MVPMPVLKESPIGVLPPFPNGVPKQIPCAGWLFGMRSGQKPNCCFDSLLLTDLRDVPNGATTKTSSRPSRFVPLVISTGGLSTQDHHGLLSQRRERTLNVTDAAPDRLDPDFLTLSN